MTDREPDYTECTLEELYDVMRTIDAKAFPERAKIVKLLIRDREAAANRQSQPDVQDAKDTGPLRTTIADEAANTAADGTSAGVLFGRGIAEIVSSLVFLGIVFYSGFIDLDQPEMRYFAAFAVFACVAGIIGGIFHLYNAFVSRRPAEQDFVARWKEPDPFDRYNDRK
ncbi:MAG: hypothetical protein QNJ14_01235 [Woeseiaceae bacterium]|nr:hypothetical protein [Woeseiaceae bacterium]